MTEPTPRIDFANLPSPTEGFLVTLFITVRKVARSRDFYSRVLGGTVVLDENPCIVRLSNSWIIMNPGGPPTPDKPEISVVGYEPGNTTSIFLNLRVADIWACYEEWKAKGARVRHAADRSRGRDPLLHARSGRIPHRGGAVDRPAAWNACRQAAGGSTGLAASRRRVRPGPRITRTLW
jgi:catechol 2,3-dioxygenase-like lactoylglutathione lyase family enzyme